MEARVKRLVFLQQLAEGHGWALQRLLHGPHAGWYELNMSGLIERLPTMSAVSKTLDDVLWATKG